MASLVESVFGDESLYDILGVDKKATPAQLKKAYYKLARQWHPDKCKEAGATERFQALAVVHSVLADPAKRSLYDETGDMDVDETNDDNLASWTRYWRSLFPKVTAGDIDKFYKQYRNSDEERTDVLREYKTHKGNLRKAMENIMCCDSDDEERFESLVRTAIAAKEVPALGTFAKSSKGAKASRKRSTKAEKARSRRKAKEAAEAEELANMLGVGGAGGGAGAGGLGALSAMIRGRGQARAGMLAALEEKYASKGKGKGKGKDKGKGRGKGKSARGKRGRGGAAPPSDAEFAAIQAKLLSRKKQRAS